MAANDNNYTKHYFAGNERICSKTCTELNRSIGGGFTGQSPLVGEVEPIEGDLLECSEGFEANIANSFGCSLADGLIEIDIDPDLGGILEYESTNENELLMFYTHTNHLGSSSWISDASGEAYQHLQNLPYGEQFIEQRQSSWGVVYQFTGYEKDQETGFDYAHARYYSSDLSIFLSVDPLADKYPSMSAYMYTAGNPVMLVDPDGRLKS